MNSKSSIFNWAVSKKGLAYFALVLMILAKTAGGGLYLVFSFVFCLIVWMLPGFKKGIDKTAVYIILFSLSYVLIPLFVGIESNIYFSVFWGVVPVFFYVYGRLLVNDLSRFHSDKLLIDLMIGIVFCFSSVIFYHLFVLGDVTFGMISEERLYTESGKESGITSTAVGNYLCLCFAGLSYFLYLKTDILRRVFFLLFFILALVATLYFLNRAGLVITIICFLLVSQYYSKSKSVFRVILGVLLLAFLAFYGLNGSFSNDLIEGYQVRNEDFLGPDSRIELWKYGLSNLFIHPFGWSMSINHHYCHNMWLDIARHSGIIPFTLMLIVTIRTIKRIRYLFKEPFSNVSVLLIGAFACFFLAMLVEPFLDSVPISVLVFFMLCGVLQQYTNYGCPKLTEVKQKHLQNR